MPTYEVTGPDGKKYEVTAPEGATEQQVLEYVRSQVQTPESTPQTTTNQRIGAFTRGTAAGVAGLAGLPVDTAENLVNLGIAGVGSIANLSGRPDLAPDLLQGTFGGSESIRTGLERLGIRTTTPQPQDPVSRAAFAGGRVIGGSVLPGAGLRSTVASAAGAGGAAAIDPRLEPLGSLAGVVRGTGGRQPSAPGQIARTADEFRQAGITPTVGEAAGSPFFQGLENFLSRMPGGGPLKSFQERRQAAVGATIPTGSAEQAGRAIERGTRDFLARSNATWRSLDKTTAELIGDTRVSPQQTMTKLNEVTTTLTKAEQPFVNSRLEQIKQNLAEDLAANNGQLSFEGMRSLRSRIGQLIDDSLVAGIPQGELKGLYGALSEDMASAAKAAGPKALQAWNRQNAYYRARMERIEGALTKVLGKDRMPEEIFAATAPKSAEQANLLRQVMRSLRPDERQVVSQAVVGRLGRATPGRQDAIGEIFSTDQFLTNWNKLSKGAREQLFPDTEMRSHLETVAKVSARIKDAAKIGQNYSNTAGNIAQATLYGGAGLGAVTGNLIAVPAAGAAIGAVNMTARLMTNPKFVQWLSQSTRISPERAGVHMARLAVIYNTADPETQRDLEQYAQSLNKAP